jgi:hypothetical protein
MRTGSTNLKGVAFSIPDLLLCEACAEANSLQLVVQLDYGTEVDEYEEALLLFDATTAACRWIMWRSNEKVWVQPLIGRSQGYDCVADAMSALSPPRVFVQTDISIAD